MPPAPPEVTRIGNLLVWLGGGNWRDIADADERSTYSTAGFIVLLNAVITWVVAAAAFVAIGDLSPFVAVPVTLLFALLIGAFGRVLASRMAQRRSRVAAGDVVRAGIAVLLGLLVGELAAMALFAGPINAELNARVAEARGAVDQSELDRARAERQRRQADAEAAADRTKHALLVARCEYNPAPDCPPEITGDPGIGAEARQAQQALDRAEAELADARAARDAADEEVATLKEQVEREQSAAEALARADNGIDARWSAMHAHTADNPVAMVLRLGVDAFFVVLNLLPLLMRLLRGETLQDSRILARRERLRAEEDAATAIALKRAEERAAAEDERATDERPVLAAADRETLQLPPGESADEVEAVSAEPVESDNLPVPVGRGELQRAEDAGELVKRGPLAALPGPLPKVARAVTGMVRPLVPERIVPNPVKTAKSILEEVEEWRFTLTHRRKVTVESEEPETGPSEEQQETARLRQSAMATRILDSAGRPRDALAQPADFPGLTRADVLQSRRELPLGEAVPEIPGTARRELPSAGRRELPPGEDEG